MGARWGWGRDSRFLEVTRTGSNLLCGNLMRLVIFLWKNIPTTFHIPIVLECIHKCCICAPRKPFRNNKTKQPTGQPAVHPASQPFIQPASQPANKVPDNSYIPLTYFVGGTNFGWSAITVKLNPLIYCRASLV